MSRSYESNGPDVKIRGTAAHIADKYVQLSRDALSSGDPVAAENYMQHAEHYYRVLAAAQSQFQPSVPIVRADDDREEYEDDGSLRSDGDSRDDGDDGDDAPMPGQQGGQQGGQQQGGHQAQPQHDGQPRQNRQRDDRPARDDRPREDRPRDDRPREDRPRDDRLREERRPDPRPRAAARPVDEEQPELPAFITGGGNGRAPDAPSEDAPEAEAPAAPARRGRRRRYARGENGGPEETAAPAGEEHAPAD